MSDRVSGYAIGSKQHNRIVVMMAMTKRMMEGVQRNGPGNISRKGYHSMLLIILMPRT